MLTYLNDWKAFHPVVSSESIFAIQLQSSIMFATDMYERVLFKYHILST